MGGYHQLWLAEHYLLSVQSNGYTEIYKRFYYKEIQAIVARRTRGGFWLSLFIGLGALGFLGLAIVVRDEPVAMGLMVVIMLAFLAGLIVHIFQGPTCECVIKTAIQYERLPALTRLPKTLDFIARMRPLIEVVQGPFAPSSPTIQEPVVPQVPEQTTPTSSPPETA